MHAVDVTPWSAVYGGRADTDRAQQRASTSTPGAAMDGSEQCGHEPSAWWGPTRLAFVGGHHQLPGGGRNDAATCDR